MKNQDRRKFLKAGALGSTFLATSAFGFTSDQSVDSVKKVNSANQNQQKRILGSGKQSLEVSAIGLGCMSMTSGHYNPPRSKAEMIPVLRGAFDQGVTFFDTAEYYGPYTNEELVGAAFSSMRDKVVIASKFGFKFENGKPVGRSSKPADLKKAVDGMLSRLKTDFIDLLYIHRTDPNVPIEEVAGTMGELIKEGKARYYGLSEVSPDTLRRAHKEQKVTALQSEYSLVERVPENQVLDTCEELGIGFVPWSPVCRGFLGDKFNEYSRFSEDSRFVSVPYFTPEAIEANLVLLNLVREWGDRKNATPAQISLAWLLAQKPWIVPIPGTTKLHRVIENHGAIDVQFTADELAEFRTALSKIDLVGVRTAESVFENK